MNSAFVIVFPELHEIYWSCQHIRNMHFLLYM